MIKPRRRHVYWVILEGQPELGRKPYLVVSNDRRNRALNHILAVRITTRDKPFMRTNVPMTDRDDPRGYALCDEITLIRTNEIVDELGVVTRETMLAVEHGLLAALDIE